MSKNLFYIYYDDDISPGDKIIIYNYTTIQDDEVIELLDINFNDMMLRYFPHIINGISFTYKHIERINNEFWVLLEDCIGNDVRMNLHETVNCYYTIQMGE